MNEQKRVLEVRQYKTLVHWVLETRVKSVQDVRKEFKIPEDVVIVKEAINNPYFIWGVPGIGKSQIVEDLCRENGWLLFDLRMSQLDPSDLRGLPVVNRENGKVDFQRYESVMPCSSIKQPMIILLDEFPQASELVQSAGYQLIHDRKVGGHILPENAITIACGNNENDGGVYFEMAGALKDRFNHVELVPDYDSFIKYLQKKFPEDKYENLISYLMTAVNNDPKKVYDYKPELFLFPTFRSWERVFTGVKYNADVYEMIYDSVGSYLSSDFRNFVELVKDIPSADVLIQKKIYYSDIAKQMVACQRITNYIVREKSKNQWNDFKYFIDMKNPDNSEDVREELTILFLTNLKENFAMFSKIAEFYANDPARKFDDFFTMIFKKYGILNDV